MNFARETSKLKKLIFQLVGSVPNFSSGSVDNIPAIAEVHIPFHTLSLAHRRSFIIAGCALRRSGARGRVSRRLHCRVRRGHRPADSRFRLSASRSNVHFVRHAQGGGICKAVFSSITLVNNKRYYRLKTSKSFNKIIGHFLFPKTTPRLFGTDYIGFPEGC